jgi:CubicO group peptidase (beta-lactamase class C family)
MSDSHDAFRLLEGYVQQHIQQYRTPGLALALTDREQTLHVSTYGFADLATQTPVTPETLFQIGSISKSFTALALMQQYEAGSVNLHAPVTDYLPWFVVRSTYEPITLHHLLCHTSGIVTGSNFTPASSYEVAALRYTEVGFSPGKRFHYSNIGYVTLGYILEAVLGQNYGDIIRSHILQPLEMHATDATITNATRPQLAVGHVSFYDDRPPHSSYPCACSVGRMDRRGWEYRRYTWRSRQVCANATEPWQRSDERTGYHSRLRLYDPALHSCVAEHPHGLWYLS